MCLAGGAIEAEAAMLGHASNIAVTGIVGCCIRGILPPLASSTDIVLTVTKVSKWCSTLPLILSDLCATNVEIYH